MSNKLNIKKSNLLCGAQAKHGFTLVELLIAVSLFTVIAFFSLGALLSIYDSNKKSQTSKTVIDNLNLSIENMTRAIRFGSNYYCGEWSGDIPNDCSEGGNSISVTFNGSRYIFRQNGTVLQKSENGGGTYTNITSSDTVIQDVKFYVFGSQNANRQPYVIAIIKGYVGTKPTTQTSFSIETMMSQRTLNI